MYLAEPHDLAHRLGLNVPREQWPTAEALADLVGAGFRWVQLHSPPSWILSDPEPLRSHARALRTLLDPAGLRLVIHGPDALSAGTPNTDAVFTGLIEYAAEAGAELVAYHGLNFPDERGPRGDAVRERALLEERSLVQHLQQAHTLGVTVAIENLAPVFPGPRRLSHDPIAVRDLVRRLATPAAGMLLDLGHLHVTSDTAGSDPARIAAACAPDVVLFHVHDNFGARTRPHVAAPGVDPLRIDLHLAPGSGTFGWARVAPVIEGHGAPLLLEVHPQHRPALTELQCRTAALLTVPAVEQAAA